MKPTVQFFHDTRRAKKNNAYPVKIRVTYQRQQKYYSTGIDLSIDVFAKVMSPKVKQAFIEKRIKLDGKIQEIRSHVNDMQHFTFGRLDQLLLQSQKDANDIFPLFEEIMAVKKKKGKIKTSLSYQSGLNSLKAFRKKIGFYDIISQFLEEYEHFMLLNGYSPTTVGIYLRNLRAIYNLAIKRNIVTDISQYPFKKESYTIPKGRNIKKALTLEEVRKIAELGAFVNEKELWARDMWLFSYLCNGINPSDIYRLRKAQRNGDYIVLTRKKTEDTATNVLPIVIYLREEAKQIIHRWGYDESPYIFEGITDDMNEEQRVKAVDQKVKLVGKYMKRVFKRLGIEKPAGFYTARHSFSTILKNNGQSVEVISEALGHASINTTRAYLNSFREEIMKTAAEKLL